ncbi:efflux RND transporter periplasmic adaptor subunit [Acetohalobium arabaticum]|uniref:Efflux transporter, RND family, MFP subunit n=1 Tax=Acetohalobium arabaticum (strain ATCC 49924 / DSM 5501 / Z-7288) TaxID=574087 RepID=D9QS64_ACEAZ|nr:efflux RND transporter periplasmic adaptor subunit [Acetohalobium arabaticum]ADL13355.1 efflux transporter, RND family, MFP subunit [Acetohalobium arabaticum DSM 5501]
MKNGKLVILLASLLIFSLVISGCSSQSEQAVADSEPKKQESVQQEDSKDSKLVVQVAEATRDDLKVELDFTGELAAYREVNLVPEISGVVREIKFEENDQVNKGQLLLKLDQAMEQAEVEKVEGNLEVAKSRLDNARKKFKRIKSLYEKNVISKSEYDSTKSKYEVARAQLKQAKASLNSAETQLNKTTIESPIKGVIAQKRVELGEMATTGNPVAKIVQLRPLEFEGSISTTDLTKVEVGQSVTVEVDSYPERTFTGEVNKVAPTVNPSNRGLKVTVQLANEELLLKPGMFAAGRILVDELENVLVVPKAAVKEQNSSQQILVVKNGTVENRDVETGPANNNRIVVTEGLKPGEKAVVRGPANLQSGTEVEVTEWGETE